MSGLLIHPNTRQELDNYLARPSHALLLAGLPGSGRLETAKSLAAKLLSTARLENNANFRTVEPDEKGNIPIDAIRQLKQFVRLKSSARRAIIINDADRMQSPAQNSFLKLLEEPPAGVFIILLAPAGSLKPTINSRLQKITIRPVSLDAAIEYFSDFPAEAVEKSYQISGGRVGLLKQLLEQTDDHPISAAVSTAREILGADLFGRLCLVDALVKDKQALDNVLEVLARMAESALGNSQDSSSIRRWHKVLSASYEARISLDSRANPKLVLSDLMLNL